MRAAVCRAFGAPLAIEDLRLDSPQAGEVRVDVAACAWLSPVVCAAAGTARARLAVVASRVRVVLTDRRMKIPLRFMSARLSATDVIR